MQFKVTRYIKDKAGSYQDGKLKAFDLVPEDVDCGLVFHWVEVGPGCALEPELNTVAKTFLIFRGSGVIAMDGAEAQVWPGDAVWLPEGSTHVIRTGDEPVVFVVVKPK